MRSSKIFIIGAGAIGKALAVALVQAGKEVILLRGRLEEQPPQVEQICLQLPDGAELRASVAVHTLRHHQTLDGLIVVASKSYGNPALAHALITKANDSPVVLLQNGLGVEQAFLEQGFTHLYRCVLFVTSQLIGSNRLQFKPVAVCPIGLVKGNRSVLEQVVEGLNTAHFQFRVEPNLEPIIWKKAIVNSVFNSVCPLLEADNGLFHQNPAALSIAQGVIQECLAVAQASGIDLSEQEVIQSLLQISQASEGQLISTLQDIRNQRRTEIDTLNFQIVRRAEQLQRGHLVPKTRLLGQLLELKADLAQLQATAPPHATNL